MLFKHNAFHFAAINMTAGNFSNQDSD